MVVLVATRDVLEVRLGSGERIKCESDAIVTAGANASIDASMDGGFFGALARTALTGESFFLTTLSNRGETSMLVAQLSPQLPGEVHVLNQVPRGGLTLTHGAFLACGDAVSVSSRIQRSVVNSIFSGAGLAVIDVSGQGPVAFSGFGALLLREVPAGEELLVDNGHLVGYTGGMEYTMAMANSQSMFASIKSGEGLMCKFRGPGTVFVQSRNIQSFRAAIGLKGAGGGNQGNVSGPIGFIIFFIFVAIFLVIFVFIVLNSDSGSGDWVAVNNHGRRREF